MALAMGDGHHAKLAEPCQVPLLHSPPCFSSLLSLSRGTASEVCVIGGPVTSLRDQLRSALEARVRAALELAGGNVSAAARSLETPVRTLHRHIDSLHLRTFVAECRVRATLADPRHECHGGGEVAQVPEMTRQSPGDTVESLETHDTAVIPEPDPYA